MKEKRDYRSRPTHMWPFDFLKGQHGNTLGKGQVFFFNKAATFYLHGQNILWSLPHHIQK